MTCHTQLGYERNKDFDYVIFPSGRHCLLRKGSLSETRGTTDTDAIRASLHNRNSTKWRKAILYTFKNSYVDIVSDRCPWLSLVCQLNMGFGIFGFGIGLLIAETPTICTGQAEMALA